MVKDKDYTTIFERIFVAKKIIAITKPNPLWLKPKQLKASAIWRWSD